MQFRLRIFNYYNFFINKRNIYFTIKNFQFDNSRDKIESKYQRQSLLEHVLHRPDSYVGSLSKGTRSAWVYDVSINKIIRKEISFSPALFKIFDEILVNAADNKIRDKSTSHIKINVDNEANVISISNNGCGIPVIIHSQEGIYIPSLIFGHLLTSSNYDDSLDKFTGGRNGFGAKLCNIFSTEFTVETSNAEYGYSFSQTWRNNMTTTTDPIIKPSTLPDFTTVTFKPDLSRFDMDKIDTDIVSMFQRRAFDIAACTNDLSIHFNDSLVPVRSFHEYVQLFQTEDSKKIVYKKFNDKWEVAVTVSSNDTFQQMSFVNGINTVTGGCHVNYIIEKLLPKLFELAKTKMGHSMDVIKPQNLKNCISIFINCYIKNPTFESQSKECLTLLSKEFGSTCDIGDEFVKNVANCGVFEKLKTTIAARTLEMQNKMINRRATSLVDITKLDDAILAGSKQSKECTLILTEGDSAKALALSGLSVIGKKCYGVYPLKGKLLNILNVFMKRIVSNIELRNVTRILGLQYNKKYITEESRNSLRYGKIMIMVDQDHDGSHIKGLIINFIHYHWPELLSHGFIEQFITPLIKAFKGNNVKIFFSENEYKAWRDNNEDAHTWRIKYYKGLGTSSSSEAKEYFSNINRHRIPFVSSDLDKLKLTIAFDKNMSEKRKVWLTEWMQHRKEMKQAGLQEEDIYDEKVTSISYSNFVDKELVQYFNADNVRSIPSMMDGLKPSQRKILYTCLKRDLRNEIKVAQLAGSVAELSAYHHGELALNETIIGLAQDYVGSNNINLLKPIGQFGTRVYGGKDCASARYIFTQLSPLTRVIFNVQDDPLLSYLSDNNLTIEPEWYAPVIPMILVNGCEGIGTGWRSIVPCFNPFDVISNLKKLLSAEMPTIMEPWYRKFTGEIKTVSPTRFVTEGKYEEINPLKIVISELPLKKWTQTYRDKVLKKLSDGTNQFIKRYEDHSTDTDVKIVIYLNPELKEKVDLIGYEKLFNLKSYISTKEMVLFDEHGSIKRYDSAEDILLNFFRVRLPIYDKRKSFIERQLDAEYLKLENQYRFIKENIEGIITIGKVTVPELESILATTNYDSDPVKAWQLSLSIVTEVNDVDNNTPDFDYLTGIRLKSLTVDNVRHLEAQKQNKLADLSNIRGKSSRDLWQDDLSHLEEKLQDYYSDRGDTS